MAGTTASSSASTSGSASVSVTSGSGGSTVTIKTTKNGVTETRTYSGTSGRASVKTRSP